MGVTFDAFRRMPMAVWRAHCDAFNDSQLESMRRIAWRACWQLRSAGARDVEPEAMLGDLIHFERSFGKPKRRVLTAEEKFEKMWSRAEKRKAAGKLKE
jgi:hypothetical protein